MTLIRTRRELLLDGLRAAGLLAAAGLLTPEEILAQEKKRKREGKGQGKGKGRKGQGAPAAAAPTGFLIGACDWTIGKRGDPAALDLAKTLGLDGIQVDPGGPDKFPALEAEMAKQYQERMAATGMKISSIAFGIFNRQPFFEEPKALDWLAAGIDGCKALGATSVMPAFFGKGDLRTDPKNVETTIAKFKEICPKAEKAGIKILIESMMDAPGLLKILDAVGSPALGVYYDVGNTKQAGYDIIKEIHDLNKRIGEYHAKDHKTLYGEPGGEVDFAAVRKAMDDIGYRGWIHMEGTIFPKELGKEETCRRDGVYLHKIFPKQA